MIKMHLQFPDDPAWVDVSLLVRPFTYQQTNTLMNDAFESVIDTASVTLKYDQLVTARIMDSPAGDKIRCLVFDDNEQPLFSGVIAPGLRQQKRKTVEDLSLEIRDNSWKLDVPLHEDLQLPSVIDDEPVTVRAAYEDILLAAGYDALDIYPDGIAAEEPVRMISIEARDRSYRQLLDSLLRDYGYVFFMTADGRFSLYQWNREEYTPSGTVDQELSVVDPLEVHREDSSLDGINLTWSKLGDMEHVRLFSANLPVGADEASSGVTILPGGYYPEDGDIRETFQRYQTDWLDEPYQSRKSRIRNRDLSLITTEAHELHTVHQEGLQVQIEDYDRHQARILFHNPTAEPVKLFVCEIYGRALFRVSRQEILIPAAAEDPQLLRTEFVYTDDAAAALIEGIYRFQQHGNVHYRFTLRDRLYLPGEAVTIHQADPALDTVALILEASWTDGKHSCRYVARALQPFGDIDSITTAYQAAKSGKGEQGEAGADGLDAIYVAPQTANLFRFDEHFRSHKGLAPDEGSSPALFPDVGVFGGGALGIMNEAIWLHISDLTWEELA